MKEHAEIFQTAKKCAQTAMDFLGNCRPEDMNAERKRDSTWVTEADTALELRMREIIREAHPTHSILGEEFGDSDATSPGGPQTRDESTDRKRVQWILDPIDGTFSFVHGIPFFSSLIAVLENEVPIVGFACLPGLGIVMSAVRGQGVRISDELYKRPSFLGRDTVELVATADAHRFRMEGHGAVFQKLYGPDFKSRTYPDALGYYLLLTGRVRAFVDPKVEVWDVAPFHVILPEAGFAIHAWDPSTGARTGRPAAGTSVAYALGDDGAPLNCSDVLTSLGFTP